MTRAVQIAELGDENVFKIDDDNNRVGIGSTQPTVKLDVGGDVSIADKIIHTGDTNTAIRFPAADTFTVETAGSERLRILSNGLIGIGTDDPDNFNGNADDLVIFGTGHQGLTIRSGTAHDGSIMFNDTNDANQRGIIRYIHTDDAMAFHTSGGEALRITSAGLVGIGTDNPDRLLTVKRTDSAGAYAEMGASQDGGIRGLQFRSADNGVYKGAIHTLDATSSGGMIALATGGAEKLRIDSAGDMGLGVTPNNFGSQRTLHIKGPSGEGAAIRLQDNGDTADSDDYVIYKNSSAAYLRVNGTDPLRFYLNGAERMQLDSSGRLSIANDTPGSFDAGADDLVIGSASGNRGITIYTGSSDQAAIYFADGTSGAQAYAGGINYGHSENQLRFLSGGGTRMRITSAGYIGVNKSSPDRAIDVEYTDNTVYNVANQSPELGAVRIFNMSTTAGCTAGEILFGARSSGSGYASITAISPGSQKTDLAFRVQDSATFNEAMRITSGGHLLLGQDTTQTPGLNNTTLGCAFENLGANGGAFFASRAGGAGYFVNRNSDGTVHEFRRSGSVVGSITVSTSATVFNTSSDYRLKENVVDITDGITRVKQLAPKRFNFIADADTTVDGFLAHEAQTVVPEAITGTHNEVDDDNNPVYQGIDQSKLVPLLTAALQEAITKIETLETQNSSLEARLTALEG